MKTKPSKVDSLISRLASKKLVVLAISTTLLVLHYLTAEQWTYLAGLYLGAQHVHDLMINHKYGPGTAQTMPEVVDGPGANRTF